MSFNQLKYDFNLTIDKIKEYILNHPKSIKYLPLYYLTLYDKEKYSPLNIKYPWITFQATEFIKKHINKNSIIFEYGSGGSTLFFAKKTKKVISVEHDKKWLNDVKEKLKQNKIKNCSIYLIEPKKTHSKYNKQSRKNYLSETIKNYSFEKYVKKISSFEEKYFDLIMVDGRARTSCLTESVKYIKKGGLIVLDNSERERYKDGIKFLDKVYKRLDFYGFGPTLNYFWKTSIWIAN